MLQERLDENKEELSELQGRVDALKNQMKSKEEKYQQVCSVLGCRSETVNVGVDVWIRVFMHVRVAVRVCACIHVFACASVLSRSIFYQH